MFDQSRAITFEARATSHKGFLSSGLVSVGSVLGGLATMSCCMLPLALFGLGAGGAWIGRLTALAPYQPLFIALTVGFVATGFYLVHRQGKAAHCAADAACSSPRSRRLAKTALWIAMAMVAASVAFNYVAPMMIEA